METIKKIRLFFKEGTSDKVYEIELIKEEESYLVNFQFGKRDTHLQSGTKTPSSVDLEQAEKIYNKLITEKKSKGYTEDESGDPFLDNSNNRTIYLPQLLNSIDEIQLEEYLYNDNFITQEKIDGVRCIVDKQGSTIKAYNRNGLEIKLPKEVINDLLVLKSDFIVDGELCVSTYHIFDVLFFEEDIRNKPFIERIKVLDQIEFANELAYVFIVSIAESTNEKLEMLNYFKEFNMEGIVFKDKNKPYIKGRPNSLGDQLKYKFNTSASVFVTGINGKRSVSIAVLDKDKIMDVGNVRIPPKVDIPKINEVLEVQYLYAFKDSNKLFQPILLAVREDLGKDECDISQLKFKNE